MNGSQAVTSGGGRGRRSGGPGARLRSTAGGGAGSGSGSRVAWRSAIWSLSSATSSVSRAMSRPGGAEVGGEEQGGGHAEQEQATHAAADQVRQLLGRVERAAHPEVADEQRHRAHDAGHQGERESGITEARREVGRDLDEGASGRVGLGVVGRHHHLQSCRRSLGRRRGRSVAAHDDLAGGEQGEPAEEQHPVQRGHVPVLRPRGRTGTETSLGAGGPAAGRAPSPAGRTRPGRRRTSRRGRAGRSRWTGSAEPSPSPLLPSLVPVALLAAVVRRAGRPRARRWPCPA